MRTPIRYQFMLPLLAVALISLLAVGIVSSRMAMRQARRQIETQLHGVVAVLSSSSFPLTAPVLRQMSDLADAEFVLTDSSARLVSASSDIDPQKLPPTQLTDQDNEPFRLGQRVELNDRRYRHSAVRVASPARARGATILHVLFPEERFDAAYRAAFLPPMIVGAVTLMAVVLVTQLIANRLSRNLSLLDRGVQRLAGGEFTELDLPRWNDETRDLTLAMNKTAERLREYQRELRQTEQLRTVSMLGAGLAHELRNAATGCRMAVDLHAESCPTAREDESIEVARRQLQLMENRLQQLLRLGSRPESSGSTRADLGAVVTEAVDLILPAAAHAKVRVDWNRPAEPSTVHGDPSLLSEVIMNLLLNALDAAAKSQAVGGPPGDVRVLLEHQGDKAVVTVSDSGAGPDGVVGPDLFQPFVTSKPEGVGLGLAIAKQFVSSMGGDIDWRRADRRTQFRIQIPTADKSRADG